MALKLNLLFASRADRRRRIMKPVLFATKSNSRKFQCSERVGLEWCFRGLIEYRRARVWMRYLHACVHVTVFRYVGARRRKKIQFHPLGSVDGKTAEEGNPKITRPDSNGDVSFCTADAALQTPFSMWPREERTTIIITHADRLVYLYTRPTNYLYAFYRRHYTQEGKIYLIRRAIMDAVNSPQRVPPKKSQHITSFLFLLLCFPFTVPIKTCAVLPFDVCAQQKASRQKTRDEQRSFYPFGRQLDGTFRRAFHTDRSPHDLRTNTFCTIYNKLTNRVLDDLSE